MEQHVFYTTLLLKILVLGLTITHHAQCAPSQPALALMGGHLDNNSDTVSRTDDNMYDIYSEYEDNEEKNGTKTKENESEEIPDPSPLVVPGYNLPENIFNRGKPFYVEKDPLTGKIDFSHKSPEVRSDDQFYDYIDEKFNDNIYDKTNIDRKDGSISSHKQNDINQLTPNFHDFLNLPVKYNPEKYVYPLISSSYASTKIQGSVNKIHNHKDYNSYKTTTKKTISPTYYTTPQSYFTSRTTPKTVSTSLAALTKITSKPPVTKRYPEIYETEPLTNVLNTSMSHPSFGEEYDYYDAQTEIPKTTASIISNIQQVYTTTKKSNLSDIYMTIGNTTNVPIVSSPSHFSSTTKKSLSLFEQLFGDYDETVPTTEMTTPTVKFGNLPIHKTDKVDTTTRPKISYTNIQGTPEQDLTDINMEVDSNYDYNYAYNKKFEGSLPIENTLPVDKENNLSVEPLQVEINTAASTKQQSKDSVKNNMPNKSTISSVTIKNFVQTVSTDDNSIRETTTALTTISTKKSTMTLNNSSSVLTSKVTSLPLGENHINVPSINRDPIIVATQNLREKLNNEKVGHNNNYEELQVSLKNKPAQISPVQEPIQLPQLPIQSEPARNDFHINNKHAPSSSNVHIPPGQDTVSFVMGHHQSVEGDTGVGGQFVETTLSESPYDSNPFKPMSHSVPQESNNYHENRPDESSKYPHKRPIQEPPNFSQTSPPIRPIAVPQNRPVSLPNFMKSPRPLTPIHPPQHIDPFGSAVTIQPLKQSEASLAIGFPVSSNQPISNKFIDQKLYNSEGKIDFPKEKNTKITFPKEQVGHIPYKSHSPHNQQTLNPQSNKEVLKLSSKPMYHQLPSDLTPPKENEIILQPQRYDRPIRPPWDPRPGHFYAGKPEYARPPRPRPEVAYKRIDNLPNILPQFRPNVREHYPPYHFERVDNPQPLFERPFNRPIGFFEKMMPPPPQKLFRGNKNTSLRNSIPEIDERSWLKKDLQSLDDNESPIADKRVMIVDEKTEERNSSVEDSKIQELGVYQTPPNIRIANRRTGENVPEVETLQMIQAKNEKKNETKPQNESGQPNKLYKPIQIDAGDTKMEHSEKTIYKVFPVNTAPLKLDQIDSGKKEGVVVGIRAEMPLPPSKIDNDFNYAMKDRNDAPILKPHLKSHTSVKSDFPYSLEYPIHPNNNLNDAQQSNAFLVFSQRGDANNNEPKVLTENKINYNQISATLKTYTENPIAVAYTPTESKYNTYLMPEFERPGVVESETYRDRYLPNNKKMDDIIDTDIEVPESKHGGFQTPFQPSLQLDSANQGWVAVRDKNKTNPILETETTTMPLATTGEFDIEHFKPELEGGFKPMYIIPEDRVSEPVKQILEPRLEQ